MCTVGRLLRTEIASSFRDVLRRSALCLWVAVDVRQVSVQDSVGLRSVDGASGVR